MDTNRLERGDVGSGGDFGRGVLVMESVTGEESDLSSGRKGRNGDRRRRETPRLLNRFEWMFQHVRQAVLPVSSLTVSGLTVLLYLKFVSGPEAQDISRPPTYT